MEPPAALCGPPPRRKGTALEGHRFFVNRCKEVMLEGCPLPDGEVRALEVACGKNTVLRLVKKRAGERGFYYVGADVGAAQVAEAARRDGGVGKHVRLDCFTDPRRALLRELPRSAGGVRGSFSMVVVNLALNIGARSPNALEDFFGAAAASLKRGGCALGIFTDGEAVLRAEERVRLHEPGVGFQRYTMRLPAADGRAVDHAEFAISAADVERAARRAGMLPCQDAWGVTPGACGSLVDYAQRVASRCGMDAIPGTWMTEEERRVTHLFRPFMFSRE